MEGATDPDMLKERAFYKLGLFIHDRKKAMMAFGLVSCLLMTGLMAMGADWAEGFGEDDVESVNAGRLISQRFASDDDSSGAGGVGSVSDPGVMLAQEEATGTELRCWW